MIVFNGANHVSDAIKSILNQTHTNFELIIVDDGSTDNTLSILESINDNRIKIIKHQKNLGSLNARITALNASIGEYIAILDSDDISMPNRLEIQYKFLENNPEYGLIGGLAETIDNNGKSIKQIKGLALSSKETQVITLFKNCFIHSCIMYRKTMLDKFGWDKKVEGSEDFQLITDIITTLKVKNLPNILGQYRQHEKNLTNNSKLIERNTKRIILKQLYTLGLNPSDDILKLHMNFKKKVIHVDHKIIFSMLDWLDKLFNANKKKKIYPNPEYFTKISGYWFNIIDNPLIFTPKFLKPYFKSPIMRNSNRSYFQHLKFFFKCILYYKPLKHNGKKL